jgi:hypothetical protein
MAIYSLNHDSFGKTTNRAGAAGDNVRYNADLSKTQMDAFLAANARHFEQHGTQRSDEEIEAHLAQLRQGRSAAENAAYNARREATYAVRSHVIPPEPEKAAAWFDAQEKADRKNARMSDRFIGALPRELTPEQSLEAVESFCRTVTQDRIPWHFALHMELVAKDQPDWNPHTHIVFRDRDIETGRRYLYTSAGPKERAELDEKGIGYWSTTDLRQEWEHQINRALERAGHEQRIDHRTLKEQGIDRKPQIHLGPKAHAMAKKGLEVESRDFQRGNQTIPYTLLDNGTRAEHNERIKEANKEREAARQQKDAASNKAPQPETQEALEIRRLQAAQAVPRREMYEEQRRDREALKQAQAAQVQEHKAWAKTVYAEARNTAFGQVKEQMADRWKAVWAIKDHEHRREASAVLRVEQKALYAKTAAERVAEARTGKNDAWLALKENQAKERHDLRMAHREESAAMTRQHVAELLSVRERARAQELQHKTNRIGAQHHGHQGMANQQKAAFEIMRLRHRAKSNQMPTPQGSKEIAQGYIKTATIEQDNRFTIRARLNAQRQSNQLRGIKPDRGRGMQAGRPPQDEGQTQVRQAGASGPDAVRANAPADVRDRLASKDRKEAEHALFEPIPTQQQRDPRDRGGGRER